MEEVITVSRQRLVTALEKILLQHPQHVTVTFNHSLQVWGDNTFEVIPIEAGGDSLWHTVLDQDTFLSLYEVVLRKVGMVSTVSLFELAGTLYLNVSGLQFSFSGDRYEDGEDPAFV